MKSLAILFLSFSVAYCLSLPSTAYLDSLKKDGVTIWALLVAGSDTWDNYRHQSDICHSYQILRAHGVPDENIVVMMKNDIANNTENPTPGVVINRPDGPDVYKGVPHDYTGEDVTPKNFLRILQGDPEMKGVGSGKVINSGPRDHIFVYFADHGAPGLIAFPTDELYAKDLNDALQAMHKKKQYSKMVLYIEACESGSMFKNLLPDNIDIYATTAANAIESSYACYFDSKRGTYLGDLYSVKWMEDSDGEDLGKETLHQQYLIVKKETDESHVQQYGNLTIAQMTVSEFQGLQDAPKIKYPPVKMDSVKSQDVSLEILRRKLENAETQEEKYEFYKKITEVDKNREKLRMKMMHMVSALAENGDQVAHYWDVRHDLKDHECYQNSVKYFKEKCFHLQKNPYALRHLYLFVNLCEDKITFPEIKQAMDKVCTHDPITGII